MDVLHSTQNGSSTDTRDTLFLLGGVSMMVFGAGLILTNPRIRGLLGGSGVGDLLTAAIPDVERYLKLKSM